MLSVQPLTIYSTDLPTLVFSIFLILLLRPGHLYCWLNSAREGDLATSRLKDLAACYGHKPEEAAIARYCGSLGGGSSRPGSGRTSR